ncbi:MAG: hypothetical protein U0941_21665 [Planctomycetaceae bacterium]
MLNGRRRHEDLAVEIAKHPLRTILGTIDADDPEVLGTDHLNARLDDA